MANAIIYNKIIEYTSYGQTALEFDLGYSNGALGKAIAKNAKIKATILDKLYEIFPDLNREWVLSNGEKGKQWINEPPRINRPSKKVVDNESKNVPTYQEMIQQYHHMMKLREDMAALTKKVDSSLGEIRTEITGVGAKQNKMMIYLIQKLGGESESNAQKEADKYLTGSEG